VAASTDAARDFQQARDLFNQHEWDNAEAAAKKALAADPRMGDAEILLGLIATVRSRFAEAERHFLKAVALEPANYQAHAYLGSTYLQEKRFLEASRSFEKVLALKPGNAAANYNLGVVALEEGSATEALRRFEIVLDTNHSDVPALTGVLTSELLLHKTAAARRTADQLQQLLEDADPRLLQIAALLAEHGDAATAIPVLERVRRTGPQSWDVNYNLAVAYFQTARYDRAADVLRPFTGTDGNAEAFNLLGAIQEKRGRAAEAEHAFAEATAREPSNQDYRFDYGNSLVQHGYFASAVTVFRAGVADFPNSWKLKMGLGSAYYLSGNYEEAARALLEAVRLKPDSTAGWNLLGEAYESAPSLQREIEAAFASYLETVPRDPGAYYHYGAILYQRAQADGQNDYLQAVHCVNEALRLKPDFAEAHFELGLITLSEGKTEQSIASLQKAVSLEPGFAAAHYRLGLAYKKAGNATAAHEELSRFKTLKEDERRRGRVLQSLATIVTTETGSGERP
jgi:tetratricopeptide (TPR) repeat protein